MSVTAAIRRMLAAGLTVDQALIAAEAFEAETPAAPARTARQERNRRYYEAKASETRLKASEQDVSDVQDDAEAEVSPDPFLEPIPKENPLRGQKKAPSRKTRLSNDWKPGAAEIAYAVEHGFSPSQVPQIGVRFIDHHVGKGTTMADWLAAWRTWVRNEISFGRIKPEAPKPAAPRADGWPLSWPQDTCRQQFLQGRWSPGIGCPAPGEPGCRVPLEIQHEWQAEKAAQRSAA